MSQLKPKRVRVYIGPADSADPANIWVRESEPGRCYVLLHDYPDLRPQAGWHLQVGSTVYAVKEVTDLAVHVEEVTNV